MNIFSLFFPISTLQSRRWAILPKYDGWQLFFRLNGAEMWRLHIVGLSGKNPPEIKFEESVKLTDFTYVCNKFAKFNINLINLLETKILRVGWKIHEITSNKLNIFLAGFIHLKPLWHRQQALCMRIWKQASWTYSVRALKLKKYKRISNII